MRKSKHGGLASARNHGTAASGTLTTFWGGGKSSGPVTNLAENARRPGLEPLRSNGGGGRSRIGRESRSGVGRRREEELAVLRVRFATREVAATDLFCLFFDVLFFGCYAGRPL
jgi:hypothetical protein